MFGEVKGKLTSLKLVALTVIPQGQGLQPSDDSEYLKKSNKMENVLENEVVQRNFRKIPNFLRSAGKPPNLLAKLSNQDVYVDR